MTTVATPPFLTHKDQVAALLAEAGKARTLILSRRNLRRVDVGGDGLREVFRALSDHADRCAGPASRDVLGAEAAEDLGHAPAWIDAGAVYEELLSDEEHQEPADFIFCLDPWSAQLLSRSKEAVGDARWILISDVDRRKAEDHPEYWQHLERWFGSLPLSAIVSRELWDEVIDPKQLSGADPDERPGMTLHRQEPGAWQWRAIGSPSREREIVFLVRYSGSFPHLKVFLDSLARQRYPKESISCMILAKEGKAELGRYARWLELAHPRLRLVLVDGWESHLDRALRESAEATVVFVDDHAILPERFARDVSAAEAATAYGGLLLSPELTAHIITGNLDPLASYEKICSRSGGAPRESFPENARVFPENAWSSGEGGPSATIRRLAGQTIPPQETPRPVLLQLMDLP